MTRRTKPFPVLTVAALCAGIVACGGGSSSSPLVPTAVAPTPEPCTQTLVFQDAGSVPASTVLGIPLLPTSTTGRIDVIVDWTFATSPIGVYFVQGNCSLEQFNARSCNFLIRSDSGAKPRRASASNVAPGAYFLFVANFGSQAESASAQVFLKSPTCPALAGSDAGSQTHGAEVSRAIGVLSR